MKTLVVLSALATLAVAAPTLQEKGFDTYDFRSKPSSLARDKKSPSDVFLGSPNIEPTHVLPFEISELRPDIGHPTGRSFGLKKPIVIKKKLGYHLYRDSDEEQARAGTKENCKKEVKVKLCDDDHSVNTLRSSNVEIVDDHMLDNDMEHSIKMAKEAVENLQRDLQKIGHNINAKNAQWKEPNTNSELHDDVEVTRKTLDHIQRNFGNLESMSLHAEPEFKEEVTLDHTFNKARTEAERMAQWKEAIENIQKNVEIARNIEDSFKAESDPSNFFSESDTAKNNMFTDNIDQNSQFFKTSTKEEQKRSSEDVDEKINEDVLSKKASNDKTISTVESSNNSEDKMKTSASEIVESEIELKNDNHNTQKEKSAESENLNTNNGAQNKDEIAQAKKAEIDPMHPQTDLSTNDKNLMTITDNKDQLLRSSEKTQNNVETKTIKSDHELNHDIHAQEKQERDFEHENHFNDKIKSKDLENKNTASKTADSSVGIKNKEERLDDINPGHDNNKKIDEFQVKTSEMKDIDSSVKSGESVHLEALSTQSKTDLNKESANLSKMPIESADKTNIDKSNSLNVLSSVKSAEPTNQEKMTSDTLAKLEKSTDVSQTQSKSVEHINLDIALHKKEDLDTDHTIAKAADTLHDNVLKTNMGKASLSETSMGMQVTDRDLVFRPEHEHFYHRLHHPSQFEWNTRKDMHVHSANNFMDFPMRSAEHFHDLHDMEPSRHFHNNLGHMSAQPSNIHEHFMKSVDIDPSLQMNRRDNLEDDMMQWKHLHGTARVAYGYPSAGGSGAGRPWPIRNLAGGAGGSGVGGSLLLDEGSGAGGSLALAGGSAAGGSLSGASGPGAVGLFPNAKLKACGIPLLLSCSPSVTSGTLAGNLVNPSHDSPQIVSSQSGHAYRSGDDFNFHAKRDISKSNDIPSTKWKRTLVNVKNNNEYKTKKYSSLPI